MSNILTILLISVICSFGASIALVNLRKDYPVREINVRLKILIRRFLGRRWSKVVECNVCASFWMAFFVDIYLYFVCGSQYFLWPLSGFAVVGFTWTVNELLNAIEGKDWE